MTDLIENLVKATAASIELDEAIRISIGAESINFAPGEGLVSTDDCIGPPDYTGSVDVALTIIPTNLYWLIGKGKVQDNEPLYGIQIMSPSEPDINRVIAEAEHDVLEIAIVMAALKARDACCKSTQQR